MARPSRRRWFIQGRTIEKLGFAGRPRLIALRAFQGAEQISSRGKAVCRGFGQGFEQNGFDGGAEAWVEGAGRGGRGLHVLHQDAAQRIAAEWHLAGKHLVKDNAQGVEVAGRGDCTGAGLFRRHVGRGAHDAASHAQLHALAKNLGHTEITHHRLPVTREEDVARLDVAMNRALGMGIVECGGDRAQEGGGVSG